MRAPLFHHHGKPILYIDAGVWFVLRVSFRRSDGAICGFLNGRGETWQAAWADYERRGPIAGGPIVTYRRYPANPL